MCSLAPGWPPCRAAPLPHSWEVCLPSLIHTAHKPLPCQRSTIFHSFCPAYLHFSDAAGQRSLYSAYCQQAGACTVDTPCSLTLPCAHLAGCRVFSPSYAAFHVALLYHLQLFPIP